MLFRHHYVESQWLLPRSYTRIRSQHRGPFTIAKQPKGSSLACCLAFRFSGLPMLGPDADPKILIALSASCSGDKKPKAGQQDEKSYLSRQNYDSPRLKTVRVTRSPSHRHCSYSLI